MHRSQIADFRRSREELGDRKSSPQVSGTGKEGSKGRGRGRGSDGEGEGDW